jgi:hypothetical protein
MKKITIFQRSSSPIILYDESEDDLDVYNDALSKLFQTGNVNIIKTSEATLLVRPNDISGIMVEEENYIDPIDEPEDVEEKEEKDEDDKQEIEEDIITDIEK